jgi:iron complex outermembrane recepter protein
MQRTQTSGATSAPRLTRVARATALCLAPWLAQTTSWAQTPTAPTPAAATTAPAEAAPALEQIVITARKRLEPLQAVPVAVSAFSGDSLERQKITATQDLQFSLPNAMLTGGDRFTIRGIGNNAIGGENGVGLAVNGAAFAFWPTDELFDLERVEVLRGPQGTLFGRNTTGGALAVYTKRPTAEFGGNLSLELGNFNARRVGGMLNIPINDSLRQRFAGYVLKRDGFTRNEFTGNSIDGRDQYSVRSSTRLFLGDNTDINLVLGQYDEDSSRTRENKRLCKSDPVLGCSPNQLAFDSPNTNAVLLQQLGQFTGLVQPGQSIYAGALNPTDLRRVAADFDSTTRQKQSYASLEVAHEFEPATLTYVGGYSRQSINQKQDWDNAALPFRFPINITYDSAQGNTVTTNRLLTTSNDYFNDQFISHELRLNSKSTGALGWTTGVFLYNQSGSSGFRAYHPFVELIQKSQGRPAETWYISNETQRYENKAKAWFGEAQLKLSDALRATAGARWSSEERDTLQRGIVLTDVVPFTARPTIKDKAWTGRVAMDYVPAKDLLVYGSVASGYKGGGFNLGTSGPQSFKPEKVTAYELGFKSETLDRRLRANFSVFYNDYKNQQISQLVSAAVNTANVDATTRGAEAELTFAPTAALLLDANLSVLQTKYGNFLSVDPTNPAQNPAVNTPPVAVNIAGNKMPYSPKAKVKLGAQYTLPLFGSGWTATPRLDYVWQDKYYAREFNTANDLIDAWSVTNLQLRLANAGGNLQIKLYVKNLSDDNNITSSTPQDPLLGGYRNVRLMDPRTFGMQVEYKF